MKRGIYLLRIKELRIHGIGGFDDLYVSFNDQFNIICGPNGIGKTTILECIGHSFTNHITPFIRRNAKYDSGSWDIRTVINDFDQQFHIDRTNFHPRDQSQNSPHAHLQMNVSNVLVLKTNRHFEYTELNSVARDQPQDGGYSSAYGLQAADLKNWFISRFMFSPHKNILTDIQQRNLNTAMGVFGLLDDKISFSKVKIETFDILVKDKQGTELYFEYLSSGYKSVIYILLGLMKEIELRFTDAKQILFQDYSGLIIIDELDLHLHPQWQSKLVSVLKTVFPFAQFIVSTHSPHMIQVANPNEIIPLGYVDDGTVVVREVPSNDYGFQGWTVEEILTDVMGLKTVVSEVFTKAISNFEEALSEEDHERASNAFLILDTMLHPENHLRKILKIQMANLGDQYDKDK